jgi:hypothetical protein
MEDFVEELKKAVAFKDITEIGDIVLVVMDNPRSLVYGRVKGFELDTSRRDEWWHVSLQLLTVPPQEVVWTLRKEQFSGLEIFTMGGDKRFIKAVNLAGIGPDSPKGDGDDDQDAKKPKLRVVD